MKRKLLLVISENTPAGTAYAEKEFTIDLFECADPASLGVFLRDEVKKLTTLLDKEIATRQPRLTLPPKTEFSASRIRE